MPFHLQDCIRSALDCIARGTVGNDLRDIFFPGGIPIPKECALWDYKANCEYDRLAYAELGKDILSFYNSFGGYIFIGVSELKKDEVYQVTGSHRPEDFVIALRGSLESYCSAPIAINVFEIQLEEVSVTGIRIPKRPISQSPVFIARNGPEKKGRPIFLEKTTYYRQEDRNLVAQIATQWEFLNSDRVLDELVPSAAMFKAHGRIIPTNLPDRNLICPQLFGRDEILAALWAWVADEFEPIRMLAGAGGKGKTSIAYEFASRFSRHAPIPFEQVLWVSAKKFQFRGDRNEYMELPETWYSSPIELLSVLCIGTGAVIPESGGTETESEYTLRKKLRSSLSLLPCLVIVDDIDSLAPADQRRVFEIVQQVAAGAQSKFLLTTRANYAFSDNQCIQVQGLSGEAYESFVSDRLTRLGLSTLTSSEINRIQSASDGSPLWTDSVIRLLKQGYKLDAAIQEWRGKPGEDARAAALRKELSTLSVGAGRVLYAGAILRECSRSELIEVTKLGKFEFDQAVSELQTLFLVDAPKITRSEPRFSVPEATALAVVDAASQLVADHGRLLAAARELNQRAAVSQKSRATTIVGSAVKQAMALLASKREQDAVDTAEAALKSFPENSDLLLLKGRCLANLNPGAAMRALGDAFRKGQRKPLLFDMWFELACSQGSFAEALDVTNLAIDNGLDRAIWLPLKARALVRIGLVRHRDGEKKEAVDHLLRAAKTLRTAANMKGISGARTQEIRLDVSSLIDTAWDITRSEAGLDFALLGYDAIISAIQGGDVREESGERLVTSVKQLITGVDLSIDNSQSRAGKSRIELAIRTAAGVTANRELDPCVVSYFEAIVRRLEELRD